MKRSLIWTGLLVAAALPLVSWAAKPKKTEASPALSFKMKNIKGDEVDLAQYKGKVVLMVNVASKCGKTPQYEGLQKLHEKYAEKGLAILGFPCNQFGGQEPGTEKEISEFCQKNYGVKFDLFSKVDVNGDDAAPLFKLLTGEESGLQDKGPVKWNFEKFLVDRSGKVVARYRSNAKPEDFEKDIVELLGAK